MNVVTAILHWRDSKRQRLNPNHLGGLPSGAHFIAREDVVTREGVNLGRIEGITSDSGPADWPFRTVEVMLEGSFSTVELPVTLRVAKL